MNRSFVILVIFSLIFPVETIAKLTTEQQVFADSILWPTLDEITKNYPVPEIRNELKKLAKECLEHKFYFVLSSMEQEKILASVGLQDGQKVIVLFIPLAMKIFNERGKESFRDVVILGILHEYFHMSNDWRFHGNLFECESAAYWYECRELIGPMLKVGRLKNLPKQDFTMGLWRVFKKAAGDKNSPIWQKLISSLVKEFKASKIYPGEIPQ
jgi:hypothetical protein